ncbi:hypothetical protein [Polaromonas sp.]|uniref:hypothetical protein n=1 Tax=Polaromonas sp. TaxID=1869339 RepID=UPI0037C6E47C
MQYLVYFLLVDLLKFPSLGQFEKSAWTVPVRYKGRLYGVEYRKMGLGIFAPNLDPNARMSGTPSAEAEVDAAEISALIKRAIDVAQPYYLARAEDATSGYELNVVNNSDSLFQRYVHFRDSARKLFDEVEIATEEHKRMTPHEKISGTVDEWSPLKNYALWRQAEWNAQAAVDAFFCWTEHVFIHLAILQGNLKTGNEVARIAEADWKTKFKMALDVTEPDTKEHYDKLLDLRTQIRNFMAHGAFGKRGEAFSFHSGAGAVPVLLTRDQDRRFALGAASAFKEGWAINEIDRFVEHLWSGAREAAYLYLSSDLPVILTFANDGTYAESMHSVDRMELLVKQLTMEAERAANMDW